MKLELIETTIQWLGGLLAYTTLGVLLFGVWRGTQRKVGLTHGRTSAWLRSPWFYLVTSAIFIGVCYFGWIPLLLAISPPTRAWMLALGSLLYFPGMLFLLWGRLALGKNYFVSTGLGAQLFADHQLVTSGPFAIVRHPMYVGLILAALGSLFIYPTWTTLLFACFGPLIIVRAYREEAALNKMFGEQWQAYCKRVPAFVPSILNLQGKTLLIIAAASSVAVCLVHVVAIIVGPSAYRLLGAGEDFAAMAEAGSPLPALITFGLAVMFAIFGCYALSGAGVLRRLPLLAVTLLGISALYTLRGALLFVELGMVLTSLVPFDGMNILYSAASLAIGIIHLTGLKANWQQIR